MRQPRDLGLFSDPRPAPTVCARYGERLLNEPIAKLGDGFVHFRCQEFMPDRFLHESQLADLRRTYNVFTEARVEVALVGTYVAQARRVWLVRPSFEVWQQIEQRLNKMSEGLRLRHLDHIFHRRPR